VPRIGDEIAEEDLLEVPLSPAMKKPRGLLDFFNETLSATTSRENSAGFQIIIYFS
jgi:hypothetical protein